MPASAFSALACRSSIRRMGPASISLALQFSMTWMATLISKEENVNASEPAAYTPTWYTATMVPTAMRGPLTFDLDVDVCVIGGGLAGLTAAREVARRGWSVAVLETKRVAWSASGRHCGFVMPGFGSDPRRMVERVGIDLAKALWQLSEGGVDYVRTTIRETGMA